MPTVAEALAAALEHHQAGRLQEAEPICRQILAVEPENARAWQLLGAILRRNVGLHPELAEAHNQLGFALQEQGMLNEAVDCYGRALELNPALFAAHHNLGSTFLKQGKYEEAAVAYQRAIELNPNVAETQWNQAALRLLAGDFERGWPQYEWRWKTGQLALPKFPQPQWGGEPLPGRAILLIAEQGIGDTLQFVRYAPLLKNMGATVLLGCQRPLFALLAAGRAIDAQFGDGDQLPHFDVYAPLLSLPSIFKTTLQTIPHNVPYLFAAPELVTQWREKLQGIRGFRIGINWHGRENNAGARRRDVPLAQFASLAEFPNVELISLQKGAGRNELPSTGLPIVDLGDEVDTFRGAFMDTAAIIMNLDLVITSDTSVAHLAGALGVPVWLALPFIPNWRWLLDRSDSPWYPTMRLFRQKQPGDWDGVFADIRAALAGEFSL